MARDTLDTGRLYAALDAKREELGLNWRQLGHRLEIASQTFTRVGEGSRCDVDTFITMLVFLGADSLPFVRDRVSDLCEDSVMAQCSVVLRESKDLNEEQADDLMKILQAAYRCFSKSNGRLDAEQERTA